MRKLIVVLMVMLLVSGVSAFGQGLKGKMAISGYGGYSIGMGDAFKDYESFNYKYSSSAGITFGGMFHYGVTEKMMVGGELMMQSYKFEGEYKGGSILDDYLKRGTLGKTSGIQQGVDLSYSDTETKLNFLASALYALNYTEETAFYLIFGAGFYDFGDTEIGFNGGLMYTKQISPSMDLFGAPRFHVVMADETVMLLQLTAGVQFWLGGN